ncbi:unnamed protein product, partial [Psylliodes chrysocephalus]
MNSAKVSEMLSEKGKPMLIINGFRFNFHKTLSGNVKRWQYTQRGGCKSFIKTGGSNTTIIDYYEVHNHSAELTSTLNRQQLSNSIKRRVVEDICEKPSTLLHTELKKQDVESLTVNDVFLIRKNMYNNRMKVLPKTPTSLQEVLQETLNKMMVVTHKNENFLVKNDFDTN